MFFKNIRIYQLTDKLKLNAVTLNAAMADHKFTPCLSQDALKIGFTAALHPSFGELTYEVEPGLFAVALRRQEKMLPAAVINEELQPKITAAELEKGRPLSRKEKQALKEELILSLLPRAFCRSLVVNALIDDANGLLFVDTTSASRAEELLALLRKSLGSLPAVPWLDSNLLSQSMQQWLAGQGLPEGMQLGHEAELKAPDEEGARVRFSNHPLTTNEVQSHLEDKLVTQLDLHIPDQLSFRITDDGSIRRLTWHELIAGKNGELGWDDLALRLQADCLLMAGELREVIKAVGESVSQGVK